LCHHRGIPQLRLVILQPTCENFVKFTSWVQLWTKMNWLDIEIKRSEVKATMRPDVVKSHLFKIRHFWRRHASQRFAIEDHLV